jgi:L-threonylcarbamoyladenylate synthase
MSVVTSAQAAERLKNDEVVAVPTETVYGLAGRIHSEIALKRIFATKKRPFFDPLIVHVRDIPQARSLAKDWPQAAQILAEAFWPGPLTLVMPKSDLVSSLITSGLGTVGIRCPNHPIAQQILAALGEPFAAPSANLFGRTSPTAASHVIEEFSNQVDVVDGGACAVGIESTVLAINADSFSLLRPGAVTQDQIMEVLQGAGLFTRWLDSKRVDAPGQMKHHYMPSKPLFTVAESFEGELLGALNAALATLPDAVEGVVLVRPAHIHSVQELCLDADAATAARQLYASLRLAAAHSADAIVFRCREEHREPAWTAIMERISKASSAWIAH